MSGLVIPGDFALLQAFYHSGTGHACVNEMGAAFTTQPLQSDLDGLSTSLALVYKPAINNAGTYDGMKMTFVTTGPPQVRFTTSGAGPGTKGGALCPPQVQVLAAKKTGFAGRKYQGRMYFGDVAEANVGDSGNLSAPEIALYANVAQAWFLGVSSGPWLHPVLLHRDPATAPTQILTFLVQSKVSTQRRRYRR